MRPDHPQSSYNSPPYKQPDPTMTPLNIAGPSTTPSTSHWPDPSVGASKPRSASLQPPTPPRSAPTHPVQGRSTPHRTSSTCTAGTAPVTYTRAPPPPPSSRLLLVPPPGKRRGQGRGQRQRGSAVGGANRGRGVGGGVNGPRLFPAPAPQPVTPPTRIRRTCSWRMLPGGWQPQNVAAGSAVLGLPRARVHFPPPLKPEGSGPVELFLLGGTSVLFSREKICLPRRGWRRLGSAILSQGPGKTKALLSCPRGMQEMGKLHPAEGDWHSPTLSWGLKEPGKPYPALERLQHG